MKIGAWLLAGGITLVPVLALAGTATKADADRAIAAAQAKMTIAAGMHDQWTATAAAFKSAKAAAAKGDFATAAAQGQRAERLAALSIAQARSQKTAWQASVPN